MRSILNALCLISALLVNGAWASSPDPAGLVRVDLLSEDSAIAPARSFWVGVRLAMREHWHTYWRNPGDAGLATDIAWRLPEGFTAGPIVWPTPSQINVDPVATYGYEGDAVLLVRITPPATLDAAGPVRLGADVSYLVCERECIPGESHVTLDIAVAPGDAGARPDPATAGLFAAARARLPQPAPWRVTHRLGLDSVTLDLTGAPLSADEAYRARFLPYSDALIVHAAEQKLERRVDGASIVMRRSALAATPPENVAGVLLIEENVDGAQAQRAFEIVSKAPQAGAGDAGSARKSPITAGTGLLAALGLAVLGGLILNLMPCVFPVLSIKVLHLANHAGQSPARMRLHGLAYCAGVLASFAVLGGALYLARAGGEEIGWGFQLQSPVVVVLLAYGLFTMALSLSGVVNFGGSFARLGTWVPQDGLFGSFTGGLVAAVVATPCTAPFMGSALGFAMTQPAQIGLLVFLALGLGLALPFLAITFAPGLRGWLPRPGAWMETLRQVLAFPLYGTVAWLVWVLSRQVGATGMFAALAGLVVIGFAAWAFELSQRAEGRSRLVVRAAFVVALVALLPLVRAVAGDPVRTTAAAQVAGAEAGAAEPFSEARLDTLLGENRVVFVNMTAAWCITCLVNERTALSSDTVKALFRDRGIAYLKGDWTNRDPEIARVIERHGRNGVPLYLVYIRGQEPVILPQILTESIVVETIARLRPERTQSNGA